MSELGKTLRAAREAKGLSYQAVAKATKIRENILLALEGEEHELLPAPVYVRGLLRTLSRHLGFNGDQLLRMYEAAVPQARALPKADPPSQPRISTTTRKPVGLLPPPSAASRAAARRLAPPSNLETQPVLPTQAKDVRRLDLRPSAPKFTPNRPRLPRLPQIQIRSSWMVLGLLVMLFTVCGAYGTTQWLPLLNPIVAEPTQPPARLIEAPVAPALTVAAPAAIIPTATPAPVAPVVVAPPASAASTATTFAIKLEATERTWLRVEVDGKEAFEGTLEVGETKTFTARKVVTLRAGNAGGVRAWVNGQPTAVLGNSGQVVDRQWQLNAEGAVEPATPTWINSPDKLAPTATPSA